MTCPRRPPVSTARAVALVQAALRAGWTTCQQVAEAEDLSIHRVRWCVQHLAIDQVVVHSQKRHGYRIVEAVTNVRTTTTIPRAFPTATLSSTGSTAKNLNRR